MSAGTMVKILLTTSRAAIRWFPLMLTRRWYKGRERFSQEIKSGRLTLLSVGAGKVAGEATFWSPAKRNGAHSIRAFLAEMARLVGPSAFK